MTRYSQTRKQKAGTRILGRGRKGVSYYPALPCANPREQPPGKWVSKAMTSREARYEWTRTHALRVKEYDFTAHPVSSCKGIGEVKPGEQRYLLFSKYAGTPLSQVMNGFFDDMERCIRFLKALKTLRKNIVKMNNDRIFHHDVNGPNITYDEKEGKAYLIDFGDMVANPKDNHNVVDDTIGLNQQLGFFYAQMYDRLQKIWEDDDASLLNEVLSPGYSSNANSQRSPRNSSD